MAFRSAFLAVAFHASIASLVFACSTPADDTLGADEALTGSIADAKACAVRDGYRAADLSAFQHISAGQLPASVTATNPTAIERFNVTNIGTVFLVETAAGLSFYDVSGALIAKAETSGGSLAWSQPSGAAVQCGVVTPSDAGPPPAAPAPAPGDSCSVEDTLFKRACGRCGTAAAVCERAPANGSLHVSEYSACSGEHGSCAPGDTSSCGACGVRTCTSACSWGACVNAGECKPGVLTHTNAGCAPGTYRARTCSDTCTAGSFGACEAPSLTLPAVGETSRTQWDLSSGNAAQRPSSCRATAALNPVRGLPIPLHNPTATDATVQIWHSSAGQGVDTVLTTYANAIPTTDDEFRACTHEPADSCSALADICNVDGSASWAGLNNVKVPANSTVIIYSTGWASTTTGPFVLNVKTIAH